MFRELRRPKEAPEILAAQSREQYFKVFLELFESVKFGDLLCHADQTFMIFILPYELLLQLKRKLQILTLGVGGIGLVSAYVSYSPEIAAR